MVLAVVMEIFATLLTRYCHLLGGCGCPDRSLRPFKPCPKTVLSSPGLPQSPGRAASCESRPQQEGLWEPGGTYSLSSAHTSQEATSTSQECCMGAPLATLLPLSEACLKSKSIFTTPQIN